MPSAAMLFRSEHKSQSAKLPLRRYLDAKGLVALWREALLAQKVLAGETRGAGDSAAGVGNTGQEPQRGESQKV